MFVSISASCPCHASELFSSASTRCHPTSSSKEHGRCAVSIGDTMFTSCQPVYSRGSGLTACLVVSYNPRIHAMPRQGLDQHRGFHSDALQQLSRSYAANLAGCRNELSKTRSCPLSAYIPGSPLLVESDGPFVHVWWRLKEAVSRRVLLGLVCTDAPSGSWSGSESVITTSG